MDFTSHSNNTVDGYSCCAHDDGTAGVGDAIVEGRVIESSLRCFKRFLVIGKQQKRWGSGEKNAIQHDIGQLY